MTVSNSYDSPMGGKLQLRTRVGETVRVEVSRELIAVVVEGPEGQRQRASIPYPSGGYGGHELLLSSEERYLALFIYSGQSSAGYELFSFRPTLRHIGGLPDTYGEGLGPAFSADEGVIGLALATNPGLYVDVDENDVNDDGFTTSECVIDWAEVHILLVSIKTTCGVQVSVPAGFPFEGNDWLAPEELEIQATAVQFRTPWGEAARVPLPMPESVVIAGPSKRSD